MSQAMTMVPSPMVSRAGRRPRGPATGILSATIRAGCASPALPTITMSEVSVVNRRAAAREWSGLRRCPPVATAETPRLTAGKNRRAPHRVWILPTPGRPREPPQVFVA
jgi:hypothetical protein